MLATCSGRVIGPGLFVAVVVRTGLTLYLGDMGLAVPDSAIRKLDTATFTGDTWALDATLDLPAASVPRHLVSGSAVRWVVQPMDGDGANASRVVDTDTSLSTCVVKINRVQDGPAFPVLVAASAGLIASHEVSETDVSHGDVFALAVPGITYGAGSAPWLWIVPTGGCTALDSGVSP
jgi:hypothetical protein